RTAGCAVGDVAGPFPGRSAARSDALQSRGPHLHCRGMGPGSAEQRKSAAPRPGHESAALRRSLFFGYAAFNKTPSLRERRLMNRRELLKAATALPLAQLALSNAASAQSAAA